MRNVKCVDCVEYRNEWCEKIIDSPYPDMLRDCKYFHERDKDVIKVIRCKDCRHSDQYNHCDRVAFWNTVEDYCSRAERKGAKNDY